MWVAKQNAEIVPGIPPASHHQHPTGTSGRLHFASFPSAFSSAVLFCTLLDAAVINSWRQLPAGLPLQSSMEPGSHYALPVEVSAGRQQQEAPKAGRQPGFPACSPRGAGTRHVLHSLHFPNSHNLTPFTQEVAQHGGIAKVQKGLSKSSGQR